MNKLQVMRLYVILSLLSVVVMGRLAAWLNPADPSPDAVEITVLVIGSLLLAATFLWKSVKNQPDPWLFGYLWFISAAAFTSLMQYHYDSLLLITILMMYFVVSQIISSLRQLRIYMAAILLQLILFSLFTGDLKKTLFAFVIFLTASVIIYLSTGKRLQLIKKYQETEHALRAMIVEKNLYERAVRDVGTGVVIADALAPNCPVIYVNNAFTTITGYPINEVIGRNCNFLQGKNTDKEQIVEIRDALKEHSRIQLEILNYRKNHEPFWNELVISPLKDDEGTTTHFIGLQTDVTERKYLMQSEQESRDILERVLEYLKDAVILLRPEQLHLHPVMMNDAARSLFTAGDDSFLSQLDSYRELIFNTMSGDEAIEQEMQLLVNENPLYYRVVISRLDELVMLTFTDISAHKESERQLLLNKDALERTNRMKDEFLAMISHELRTPLNSILGIAQLQEEEALTSEEIGILRHASEHLLALIERILDYSAMENDNLHVEKFPFNLQELVKAVYGKYVRPMEKKSLDYRLNSAELPNIQVVGDYRRMMQIVATLLDNAVKFTPDGEVELSAAVRPHRDSDKLWLLIKVQDTGIGIPEASAEDIFQPFFQVDPSSTREYGGLGIGLAFSRKLTEMLGGTISYQSIQGEGTTFMLKLPIIMTAPEDWKERLNRKLRILLAEDNVDNQNLFLAFMKRQDCVIDVAVNGIEAVKAFTEERYDIVFMDIQMPLMDGYEATRHIRTWENEEGMQPTTIIALTAHAFEEHRRACQEAGCTDFLEKPIFREQLFQIIKRYESSELPRIGDERDGRTAD